MQDNKSKEELKEIQKVIDESQWLNEMVNTRGWKEVVIPMLEGRMTHAWIDPRDEIFSKGDGKEAWLWAELNLFYARDAARQLLEDVFAKVEQGKAYLTEKKGGELSERMRI